MPALAEQLADLIRRASTRLPPDVADALRAAGKSPHLVASGLERGDILA